MPRLARQRVQFAQLAQPDECLRLVLLALHIRIDICTTCHQHNILGLLSSGHVHCLVQAARCQIRKRWKS